MFTPAFRRFVWAGCALFAAAGTPACTLFGAVGEGMVEGGGTLAAKTRDEHPGPQRFDIAVPSKGYAYLGLFTGDKHRFNMGFNEKGLFLARSTSGSLPRKERLALPRFFKHRLSATDWIMQHYASVDEVLAHREVFVEPVNYLLADRTKIAVGRSNHCPHHGTRDGRPHQPLHRTGIRSTQPKYRLEQRAPARAHSGASRRCA